MNQFLKKYPLFAWLLPVFFVLHGFMENFGFIPVKDAMLLTGIYLLATLLFFLLFRIIYKNSLKAGLISFAIMAFHFFFGSMQDTLRKIFPGSFTTKYVFILPLSLCLFVLLILLLKKSKKIPYRLAYYLNVLLIVLLLIDIVLLTGKVISSKDESNLSQEFSACPDCAQPDVYLIIADEYAGNKELKDIFHFDDSAFITQLQYRDFHVVPASMSNYNFTPYSIASTLNMDYLDLQRTGKQPLLAYTYETISHNRFLQFLQYHHYQFYNYSFFDFKGHPTYTRETFLPVKTKLITGQTFLDRIEKEMGFHLVTDLKWKKEIDKTVYFNRINNEKLIELTVETAKDKTAHPKFVLTHLMMPHYPYYYDKNGKEFPFETIIEGNQVNQEHYIEYLQYGNKKLLSIIDTILNNALSPPVIILMGDHGFRHFNTAIDPRYYFYNMVSVHLPDKNYAAFTDSLSNVNLLRSVLNTQFKQHFPYLKDTTYIMNNP